MSASIKVEETKNDNSSSTPSPECCPQSESKCNSESKTMSESDINEYNKHYSPDVVAAIIHSQVLHPTKIPPWKWTFHAHSVAAGMMMGTASRRGFYPFAPKDKRLGG